MVDLIDAVIAFQIERGELADHDIFLFGRHSLEVIDFFLFVPEFAVDRGQLREHGTKGSQHRAHIMTVFFINFIGGKTQALKRDVALDGGTDQLINFAA